MKLDVVHFALPPFSLWKLSFEAGMKRNEENVWHLKPRKCCFCVSFKFRFYHRITVVLEVNKLSQAETFMIFANLDLFHESFNAFAECFLILTGQFAKDYAHEKFLKD